MGRGPKPTKGKAKPALSRKSPKNDGAKVRDLEKRLATALEQLQTRDRDLAEAREQFAAAHVQISESHEQQTATAQILQVISSSPTDLEPVMHMVAQNAMRVCGASDAVVYRVEGDTLRRVAHFGVLATNISEAPIDRDSPFGRAVLERRTIHIENIEPLLETEYRGIKDAAIKAGTGTRLAAPMMREGMALGVIMIRRAVVQPFTSEQIALLETFAAQAVIAIENVRLFKELEVRNKALTEALEQQTATADILQVISSSPTNVQPVFHAIAESANRLCDALYTGVFRLDAGLIHFVAHNSWPEEALAVFRADYPAPATDANWNARAILERRVMHVRHSDAEPSLPVQVAHRARALGIQSYVAVPMLREGEAIGTITVSRAQVGGFSDTQIRLLQTFADQAVIAIENVRLFTELEEKNRALTQAHAQVSEALDTQTATSEILRVISSSPTDVQPVFTAMATSAARLCDAFDATIFQVDGDVLRLVAHEGPITPDPILPLAEGTIGGRVVRQRRAVHVADMQAETETYPLSSGFARERGFRAILSVPLLHGAEAIGLIAIRRAEVRPFTDRQVELVKTFADQGVIAIENVRLFKELQEKNQALTKAHAQVTESLEQQTATSEILQVISSSPTDAQPVFDAIVQSARRLLSGHGSGLTRVVGNMLHLQAFITGTEGGDAAARAVFPVALSSNKSVHSRAVRTRAPAIVTDVETDSMFERDMREMARKRGYRSVMAVPLLREGEPIGAISVTRPEAGPFTDKQVALLQTFADQAVIAIENVRLFTELQSSNRELTEALEQQTATSEILRVISGSPTDVQPVFDTIVSSAVRLCDGLYSALHPFDGELIHLVAQHNFTPEALEAAHRIFPARPTRALLPGRAILERAVVQIPDVEIDPEHQSDQELTRAVGWRSGLFVPMLREGAPIGVIVVARAEAGPFSDNEIELLKTFADQAVIAIENVRLFTELQASNRDLTTALDKQTATSEILRVISQSPTDVQPVFEAILSSAVRLLGAYSGGLTRIVGDQIVLVAITSTDPAGDSVQQAMYPQPLHSQHPHGQAIRSRAPFNVADAQEDPRSPETVRSAARARGFRSVVAVPLLRREESVGAITVTRREAGGFADDEIVLLQTFADQAVIAIENARLLGELQARTQQLTRSVNQLTALGEVGRAVSSTLDLETVLTTIVSRAVQLSGLDGGVVFEYDAVAEEFEQRASTGQEALAEARRRARIRKGEGVVGRTAVTHEPVQVPDITREGAYESRLRESLVESGVRALLAVPMLREGHLIGSLVVARNTPGAFLPETVDLLRTFATQSALAIQNARLFREIEAKSRQLEVASQHKSEFLANMSHELRTPLNAIIGFSEVLSEKMFGELNEKQEEYSKDIHASGQHLLSLINDILDLSKIEAGRMELELSDFHLPTALDSALTLVRERAGRRGIALRMNVDNQLGQIQADERKVRQVVLNLLSNAIKFTPEGGQIEVGAVSKDGLIEVSVSDTGVGIAAEDQETVFEEFRQVGTADKKVEGTGLGLTLCRKFVELHGGRIWVKSQVGAGSTFTFTIPVRDGE